MRTRRPRAKMGSTTKAPSTNGGQRPSRGGGLEPKGWLCTLCLWDVNQGAVKTNQAMNSLGNSTSVEKGGEVWFQRGRVGAKGLSIYGLLVACKSGL